MKVNGNKKLYFRIGDIEILIISTVSKNMISDIFIIKNINKELNSILSKRFPYFKNIFEDECNYQITTYIPDLLSYRLRMHIKKRNNFLMKLNQEYIKFIENKLKESKKSLDKIYSSNMLNDYKIKSILLK